MNLQLRWDLYRAQQSEAQHLEKISLYEETEQARRAEAESEALSNNPEFLRIIERARENIKAGRTMSHEELRVAVGEIE